MLPRFPGDRPPDQFSDLFVAASLPQGAFEIHFVVRQQAGPEVPVRRQAEAVAGMTEVAAHRTDETDLPRSSGQAVDPRRSVILGSSAVDRLERPQGRLFAP